MKKLAVVSIFCFMVGFIGGSTGAQAQVSNLNEPGSILVYPLIDNINGTTIIEITNRAATDVWLQGYIITHGIGEEPCLITPGMWDKKNFIIHLTQKEVFWWNTSRPYNRTDADGILTQIQAFNNRKGFMFVWAIDSDKTQMEIDWNFLKGDALIYGGGRAFQYNAIPHQVLNINPDRVLDLDGIEYTMASSQIMVEGFAEAFVPGLGGTLAVCNLDIDFINSIQPYFDINIEVWNQNEVSQSRHLDFCQFNQYDLTDDLQLRIDQIFTPKWQFATTSTSPLWAVFFQGVGSMSWGGNVWLHPDHGTPAAIILPPVPSVD